MRTNLSMSRCTCWVLCVLSGVSSLSHAEGSSPWPMVVSEDGPFTTPGKTDLPPEEEINQRNPPPLEFTLTGTPTGGILTIGIAFYANTVRTVAIPTTAEDSLEQVVSRLNAAIDENDDRFWNLRTRIKDAGPTTLVITRGPGEACMFMRTTDTGLNVAPGVTDLSVVLDKENNSATVTWSIPEGVVYDRIVAVRVMGSMWEAELPGSATTWTDSGVRLPWDPPWQEMDVQYRVIGWKDGVPSDLADVIVYETLRMQTMDLPTGQVGIPYSQALATSGGVPPVTWRLREGSSLPPGIDFNAAAGALEGTPSSAGTFWLGVGVADSQTPPSKAGRNFKLVIDP